MMSFTAEVEWDPNILTLHAVFVPFWRHFPYKMCRVTDKRIYISSFYATISIYAGAE